MNDSGVHAEDYADPARDRRKGGWMQTYTGRQFWPLDPRPEEIDILDIAEALSKLCRYGGHSKRFYSVAEHCVLMTRHVRKLGWPRLEQRMVLLHDAGEAYLSDVIRPVKPYLSNYHEIEERLMRVIAERFAFPWPVTDQCKAIDDAILHDELEQVMGEPPVPWRLSGQRLNVTVKFYDPEQACQAFLREFHGVARRRVRRS